MTTFTTGRQAEAAATNYLKQHGYQVLDQNWRTRWCEIDIVVRRAQTVYFVEVKYRKAHWQGTGLEYILPPKLQRMCRAAEFWVQVHEWAGEYSVAAIEVSGLTFQVTNFIPDCT